MTAILIDISQRNLQNILTEIYQRLQETNEIVQPDYIINVALTEHFKKWKIQK